MPNLYGNAKPVSLADTRNASSTSAVSYHRITQ